MVKFTFAPLLLVPALLSIVGFASPVPETVVLNIGVTLNIIVTDCIGLDNDMSLLQDGLPFFRAIVLNRGIQATQTDLYNGAVAMENSPAVSSTDADGYIDRIMGVQPTIQNTLTTMCTKKPVLTALPLNMNSLAQERLTRLSNAADRYFAAASVTLANGSKAAQITVVQNTLKTAFQQAIACYSS